MNCLHKYILCISSQIITLIYIVGLIYIINYEVDAYQNSARINCKVNLKPYVGISIIIDVYTVFIGIMYYLIITGKLFIQINNEILVNEVFTNINDILHSKNPVIYCWVPLGILTFHSLALRILNIFCNIYYADSLTLNCIRKYKHNDPNTLLIYNANIGISVCCWILFVIGILIIILIGSHFDHNNQNMQTIANDETDSNIVENKNKDIEIDIENPGDLDVQNITKCCVCLCTYKNIRACVPCGHVCICTSCYKTNKNCPLCRKYIDSQIRVYLN
jgi:hypothetical protein